jgi:hypothetical protein
VDEIGFGVFKRTVRPVIFDFELCAPILGIEIADGNRDTSFSVS